MMSDISIFKKLNLKPYIADKPVKPRDSSKLMVINRLNGEIIHSVFKNLPEFLNTGDCLVINQTKVFKAKLKAQKITGGRAELLFVSPHNDNKKWNILARKVKPGDKFILKEEIIAECKSKTEDGSYLFEFSKEIDTNYLNIYGTTPLPHYIEQARKERNIKIAPEEDIKEYQTVYAKVDGAIAAPTAGFHFTNELIEKLKKRGIKFADIILHIGWGTFKPIRTKLEEHKMLPETCYISPSSADLINKTRKNGGRIIAVGTSSVRTLEKMKQENGDILSGQNIADIFIYPPYEFKTIDAFITNFHLPDSAPLAMTAAFCGIELLYKAYQQAIKNNYRFYSYGDAMLIL